MPDLFSSSTANSKYSLFVGPREAALWNDYNTEMLEIVAKQNFIYWAVERKFSEVEDLYGEAETKAARRPIQVYGLIQLDEPETITNQFGTEVKRRLEVFLHIDRLTEVGMYPQKGDFLEWDSQFFELLEVVVPQFAHGLPEIKVGVTIRCLSTREDVFNPRIEHNYDETKEQSGNDPY
jgi:hypothetical protein